MAESLLSRHDPRTMARFCDNRVLHALLAAAVVMCVLCVAVGTGPPPVEHEWVFQCDAAIGYVHMSTIQLLPTGALAVAFQAAHSTEGARDQSIFFKTSLDNGTSWSPHAVVASGDYAVPALG